MSVWPIKLHSARHGYQTICHICKWIASVQLVYATKECKLIYKINPCQLIHITIYKIFLLVLKCSWMGNKKGIDIRANTCGISEKLPKQQQHNTTTVCGNFNSRIPSETIEITGWPKINVPKFV